MWSPRLIKMWFYCWMVHFYCSIVAILLFSKLFTFKLKFGRWHIRTIGIQMWSPRLTKMSFDCCMVHFYCSIVRILLFSKLFTFKLKFGRWHIRTIGNSNVKSKIGKNVILLLYGQFLLFYCPNSIVFKTFYI